MVIKESKQRQKFNERKNKKSKVGLSLIRLGRIFKMKKYKS